MTTTSIPALLEPIQERLNAAIPGPWEPMRAGLLGTRVVAIDGEWDEGIIPPEFINMVTPAMRSYDTAVFIANAPTDTARLLAAVKAVLSEHVPVMEDGEAVGCLACDWETAPDWPCATVSAVEAALRGSDV